MLIQVEYDLFLQYIWELLLQVFNIVVNLQEINGLIKMENNTIPLILIIDDNFELRMLRQALFQKKGYKVITAENGSEGLEMALKHVPDLILLDVVMPVMNGIEVLTEIKKNKKTESVFVIMISGQQKSAEDLTKGLELGADGYLTSPIPNNLLLAQIKTFLRQKYNMDKLRISEYDIYTKNEQLELAGQTLEQKNYEYQALNKELTRTLHSLTLSEKKYKLLADNSEDVIFTMRMNGQYSFVSPSVVRAIGYTPSELMKMNLMDTLDQPSAEKARNILDKIRKDESNGRLQKSYPRVELKQKTKDGSTYWSEVILSPIRDDYGNLLEVLGVTRVIEDIKKLEGENKINLQRYRTAQKIGRVGNWEYNIKTQEFWGSEEAKRLYGFDPDSKFFTTQEVESCIPERERVHQALIDLIEADKPYNLEFDIIPKNSKKVVTIQSKAELIRGNNGNPRMVSGVIQDITERKNIERNLRESEEKFRSLSESMPIAVLIYQGNDWVYANKASEEITGYKVTELVGMNYWKIVHPDFEKLVKERGNARLQKKPVESQYEIKLVTKTGKEKWVFLSAAATDFNGKPAGILSLMDIDPLKKHETALKESETKYRMVVNNSLEGIFIVQNGKFVYVNPTFEKMLGMAHEKIAHLDFQDFIHPDDRKMVLENNLKRLKGEQIPPYDFRVLFGNNIMLWVHLNATKIVWDNQDAVLCFLTNINDRKLAEDALKEREFTLKNIVENSTNVFYSHTPDHLLTYLSPQIESILGYTPEEARINWTDLTSDHPVNKEGLANTLKSIETGEVQSPYELELVHKNGLKVWVEVREIPVVKDGKTVAVAGSLTDITARKAAEKALKESERRFRTYVESSPTPLFIADANGNYTFSNPASGKMLGYTTEELLAMSIPEILPESSVQLGVKHFKVVKKHGYASSDALKFQCKNGKIIDVLVEAVKLSDNEYMAYCRDITELKNVERELQKANEEYAVLNEELETGNQNLHRINVELEKAKEKAEESDKLKTAFLANMSHEIRTPMNGILGFAQLLNDSELSSAQQKQYVEIIEKSGQRMLNIINDLINISKIEAGQMEISKHKTNVDEQMQTLYQFFLPEAKLRGLDFKFKTDPKIENPHTITDPEKLYAVLTNLVKNALKYTNKGSVVYGYTCKSIDDEAYLEFFVEDTGIGIASENVKQVFERFVQAEKTLTRTYEGAGLGLAISKAYIEMLGGKIWLQSALGQGSTFYFTIPFLLPDDEVNKNDSKVPEIKKQPIDLKLNILIAEDTEFSQYFLKSILRPISNQIFQVDNGNDAIKIIRENPEIDLVLMDIRMPEMGGYEATRAIRKFNTDVVIIAQTAYAMLQDREKALEAGCDDYIAKPIKKEQLYGIITKLMIEKRK